METREPIDELDEACVPTPLFALMYISWPKSAAIAALAATARIATVHER
jgi:hypothetical protein